MNRNLKKIIARESLIFIFTLIFFLLLFSGFYIYNLSTQKQIDNNERLNLKTAYEIDSLEQLIEIRLSKQKWIFNKYEKNSCIIKYNDYNDFWKVLIELYTLDYYLVATSTNYPNFVKSIFRILKDAYAEKFTHTPESFKNKLLNNVDYSNKIFGIFKEAFGDNFTLSFEQFETDIRSDSTGNYELRNMIAVIELPNNMSIEEFIEINSIRNQNNDLENLVELKRKMLYEIDSKLIKKENQKIDDKVFIIAVLLIIAICFPIRYLFYLTKWSLRILKNKD